MDILIVGLKLIVLVNFILALHFALKNHSLTRSQIWLFLVMSLGMASLLSGIRFLKELLYPQFPRLEHLIVVLELLKINLIPFVTAFLLAAALTISRGHLSTELPMGADHRPVVQHGVEQGKTYLIKEETPRRGFLIFLDLISSGYQGLGILRTHPDEVRREYDIEHVPILWMSRLQVGENVIYPSIRVIEQILEEFIAKEGNRVIFIERLDYLITQRGFEKTLQFIQKLSSLMYVTKSIAMLHIDPLTISERELVLIEKETKGLKEPFIALEEDLHEMLSYIHEKNSHGIKPNLKQVTRELDLSRNTARKRIQSLQLKGFVILREKGREKVLEITRKGEENI
jgi:predicted transcriptional regulator